MTRGRGRRSARLFAREELRLRPTGQARLKQLARVPAASVSLREQQRAEDEELMVRLRTWGADLAARFRLRCRSLEPERQGVVEHYGICYEDGTIRIRLRHATTGRLLKESSLVDTLCHELAHLRQLDHSERFRRLYQKILSAAREAGYYRPGLLDDGRPTQLGLFNDCCGTEKSGLRRRDAGPV